MDRYLDFIFYAALSAIAGYIVYQIFTKGFKGALFGGNIVKTYGEVDFERRNAMWGKLKVHKVLSKNGERVGIEMVHKSILSYQIVPATLSKDEARRLIRLLSMATDETVTL